VRDKKTAVKTLAIEEVMFLRGCQPLGLLSFVFLVVKSSDFSGKWFGISTSDFIAFDQNAIK